MRKAAFLICLAIVVGPAVIGYGAAANGPESQDSITCPFDTGSKEEGVLLAWVTNVREFTQFAKGFTTETKTIGPFRPFALITNRGLQETLGASIATDQPFWRVLSPASTPAKLISVGSLYDYLVDRCAYHGTLDSADLPPWTLLSSKPLPGVFRVPSHRERAEFHRLNRSCVVQGDYPEGKAPPCTRPELLAITDLNKNGKAEYWATRPYTWDTGLAVWEKNAKGKLVLLLETCVACDD